MTATAPDAPRLRRGPSVSLSLAALGVVLAGVIAYANAIDAAFVLDDLPHIVDNPWIAGHGPWSAALDESRPLVAITLRANHALNAALGRPGLDPTLFHAFNIAVHLIAALLLFELVRRTLGRVRRIEEDEAVGLAFAVALLWVVHPLTTQAVTYTIQRSESLMAMFFLASLAALERGDRAAGRGRWAWMAAAVAAGLLSMASKQVAVVLPAVALLYDRAFLARGVAEPLRRRWPVYAALGAGALALIASEVTFEAAEEASAGFGMTAVGWWEYARTQPMVVLHYVRLALWPAPLVFDYDWRPATDVLQWAPSMIALGVVVAASVALLVRSPRIGFLPAAFFLVLAPTSSVMPIADLAVEHRMYLPLAAVAAGAVLAAAWALRRWGGVAWRHVGVGLLFCAAAPLAVLTIARNEDYSSQERLWRDTIAKAPANPRAHHNLANVLTEQGRYAEAIAAYEATLALEPGHAQARVNLGVALKQAGRPDLARAQFEEVARHVPDFAPALHQLGVMAAQTGEPGDRERALELLLRAVESDPTLGVAWADLGNVRLQSGDTAAAIAAYQRAIELGAGTATLHNTLGIALAQSGRVAEAAAHFAKAVELDPTLDDARANLGRARQMLQIGRPSASGGEAP